MVGALLTALLMVGTNAVSTTTVHWTPTAGAISNALMVEPLNGGPVQTFLSPASNTTAVVTAPSNTVRIVAFEVGSNNQYSLPSRFVTNTAPAAVPPVTNGVAIFIQEGTNLLTWWGSTNFPGVLRLTNGLSGNRFVRVAWSNWNN